MRKLPNRNQSKRTTFLQIRNILCWNSSPEKKKSDKEDNRIGKLQTIRVMIDGEGVCVHRSSS
jgi:hypothetical protein